jgi:hypothetical protein
MISYDQIPSDPVMLLSFVNTSLRDNYDSFEELCASCRLDPEAITAKLEQINYRYDPAANQFI